jgi:hypothetical protein
MRANPECRNFSVVVAQPISLYLSVQQIENPFFIDSGEVCGKKEFSVHYRSEHHGRVAALFHFILNFEASCKLSHTKSLRKKKVVLTRTVQDQIFLVSVSSYENGSDPGPVRFLFIGPGSGDREQNWPRASLDLRNLTLYFSFVLFVLRKFFATS